MTCQGRFAIFLATLPEVVCCTRSRRWCKADIFQEFSNSFGCWYSLLLLLLIQVSFVFPKRTTSLLGLVSLNVYLGHRYARGNELRDKCLNSTLRHIVSMAFLLSLTLCSLKGQMYLYKWWNVFVSIAICISLNWVLCSPPPSLSLSLSLCSSQRLNPLERPPTSDKTFNRGCNTFFNLLPPH